MNNWDWPTTQSTQMALDIKSHGGANCSVPVHFSSYAQQYKKEDECIGDFLGFLVLDQWKGKGKKE